MWLALTGTPGTGKTLVSRILSGRGLRIVDLNALVKEHGFVQGHDMQRDTDIADIDAMIRFLERVYPENADIIIEGHWSHLVHVGGAFVLRCDPRVLMARLEERGYSKAKLKENIEAETLDVILIEAIEALGKDRVAELDTTNRGPEGIANAIEKVLNGDFISYKVGCVDWSGQLLE